MKLEKFDHTFVLELTGAERDIVLDVGKGPCDDMFGITVQRIANSEDGKVTLNILQLKNLILGLFPYTSEKDSPRYALAEAIQYCRNALVKDG